MNLSEVSAPKGMSKHVRGTKGKYIVKLRDKPLAQVDVPKKTIEKDISTDNLKDLDTPDPVQPPTRPLSMRPPARPTHATDPTINLEILEQLRSLGEEMRSDRFMREQKQYIKHVVNKEISKSRIRSKYVPEIFPDEPSQPQPQPQAPAPAPEPAQSAAYPSGKTIPDPTPDPVYDTPSTPVFRSRIRR